MATAQTIVGIFFTADRDALVLVGSVMFFVSVATVALLARRRKWPEILCLFLLVYLALVLAMHVLFSQVVEVPFLRLEPVSISTD